MHDCAWHDGKAGMGEICDLTVLLFRHGIKSRALSLSRCQSSEFEEHCASGASSRQPFCLLQPGGNTEDIIGCLRCVKPSSRTQIAQWTVKILAE
jgi:hypothetical protein